MTAFAIFAMTTAGLVQIQRISRERAPLSMMVVGRGSERLAISDRYDDFVFPGGGPVEKYFGPFPKGGFRLEVSTAIDSGDSWQLAVFIAHAVVASGEHMLCREALEADCILCLTGTVDFDGQVGGVGHIGEKAHAAADRWGQWKDAGLTPFVAAPLGDDLEQLHGSEAMTGSEVRGVGHVAELCRELEIPLIPAAPANDAPPPADAASKPKRSPLLTAALVLVAFAAAAGTGIILGQRQTTPPPPPTTTPPAQPANPVEPAKPTAPAKDARKAAQTQAPAELETSSPPKPVPTKAVSVPPSPGHTRAPRLSVVERHAPIGHACGEVFFGDIKPMLRQVQVISKDRFRTSRVPTLCGLVLRIE